MRAPTWWKDLQRLSQIDIRWLFIWSLIYITFLFLDIIAPGFSGTALIKYIGIFLCISYAYQKFSNDYLLIFALLFTFIADTILVWTPFVIPGVYVFCIAQFLHFMRLTKMRIYDVAINAGVLSLIFAIGIAFGLEPIYAIATVYAILLISNVIMSVQNYRDRPKHFRTRCACYGFIAFICCDLCVALRFLSLTGAISATTLPIVAYFVWVFYLPSQILIANSSTFEPQKRRRKIAKNKRIR